MRGINAPLSSLKDKLVVAGERRLYRAERLLVLIFRGRGARHFDETGKGIKLLAGTTTP